MPEDACPLCGSARAVRFGERRADGRSASCRHCPDCDLRFVERAALPDPAAERERYLRHRNTLADAGYRAFLLPALDAVRARVPAPETLLDFGSGPEPAFAWLAESVGYRVRRYDPFFSPDWGCLGQRYRVIVAIEVVEHFHDPAREFALLSGLLAADGILVVMTALADGQRDFRNWHYATDPTHVAFYGSETFAWIARRYGLEVSAVTDGRLVVLARQASASMS